VNIEWVKAGAEPLPRRPCSSGMDPPRRAVTVLSLLAVTFLHPAAAGDLYFQQGAELLRAEFSDQAIKHWVGIKLATRANRFTVVEESGRPVLMAESEKSASALWYRLDMPPHEGSTVAWRWKVGSALTGNTREREKKGDDYAARFFVIFDAQPFSREGRAICYVWAAGEPVGAVFRNPYFPNVITVVLESGDAHAGEWVAEERDFVSDYRQAFGDAPEVVTAVAVMVDTDNTKRSATAWFDEIRVRLRPPDAPISKSPTSKGL
jgi:Protein of unknown function (DUF3047)